jgi:single-strand DNA-binding protein
MNRWTGTAHLTRDPELVTTSGGTDICLMRIAVKRAAREGAAGYFDVKAFGDQAAACADYLSAGREVGIEGRLRFEEFETKGGDYAARVYIVADAVEFLASRRRDGDSQADDAQGPGDQAESARRGQLAAAGPRPARPRARPGVTRRPATRNPNRLDPLAFSGCFAYLDSDAEPARPPKNPTPVQEAMLATRTVRRRDCLDARRARSLPYIPSACGPNKTRIECVEERIVCDGPARNE